MKKILLLGAILALTASLSYCSDDSQTNGQTNSITGFASTAKTSSPTVLFKFTDKYDFETNFKSSIIDELNFYTSERASMPNVTRIISFLKVMDGQVVIKEKYYIDEKNKMIIRSLILDDKTLTFHQSDVYTTYEGTPVETPVLGICPGGSTEVGYCGPSSIASMSECIGNLAAQVAIEGANNGWCANALVQEGLFGAAVCSTGCN